jgi:ElaB/YqjD/DUF883 family membrane-anchored ribosome-binding protein
MLEQQPGQLGADNEETRPAFVDTLEAMEDGLKDAMHGTHDAITAATDAANETMEATGQAARQGARGAADGLAWALDVPGHVSRHPWLLVGAAVLVGLLILRLRRRE